MDNLMLLFRKALSALPYVVSPMLAAIFIAIVAFYLTVLIKG